MRQREPASRAGRARTVIRERNVGGSKVTHTRIAPKYRILVDEIQPMVFVKMNIRVRNQSRCVDSLREQAPTRYSHFHHACPNGRSPWPRADR